MNLAIWIALIKVVYIVFPGNRFPTQILIIQIFSEFNTHVFLNRKSQFQCPSTEACKKFIQYVENVGIAGGSWCTFEIFQ